MIIRKIFLRVLNFTDRTPFDIDTTAWIIRLQTYQS